jgi:hypothetical protein
VNVLQLISQTGEHLSTVGWFITEEGMANIRETMGEPDVDMIVPLTDDVKVALHSVADVTVSHD